MFPKISDILWTSILFRLFAVSVAYRRPVACSSALHGFGPARAVDGSYLSCFRSKKVRVSANRQVRQIVWPATSGPISLSWVTMGFPGGMRNFCCENRVFCNAIIVEFIWPPNLRVRITDFSGKVNGWNNENENKKRTKFFNSRMPSNDVVDLLYKLARLYVT